MTKEKVKLSEVLAQITEVLKKAIDSKETGVVYAYKGGTKFLSLSIENVVDDVEKAKEADASDGKSNDEVEAK